MDGNSHTVEYKTSVSSMYSIRIEKNALMHVYFIFQ